MGGSQQENCWHLIKMFWRELGGMVCLPPLWRLEIIVLESADHPPNNGYCQFIATYQEVCIWIAALCDGTVLPPFIQIRTLRAGESMNSSLDDSRFSKLYWTIFWNIPYHPSHLVKPNAPANRGDPTSPFPDTERPLRVDLDFRKVVA